MNTRDLGLSKGQGKGDKPRHKLDDNYRRNYDSINWRQAWTEEDAAALKRLLQPKTPEANENP